MTNRTKTPIPDLTLAIKALTSDDAPFAHGRYRSSYAILARGCGPVAAQLACHILGVKL